MATTNGSTPANGNLQQQAALNGLVEQDEAKGRVPVHTFDPDAPTSEKAAAAAKNRDKLASVQEQNGVGEREVAIDTGAPQVIPTITIEDSDEDTPKISAKDAPPISPGSIVEKEEAVDMPGSIASQAAEIPDWYKVGWRAVSDIDKPPLEEGEEKDKGVLAQFLSEQYYGDWYHNAAIIFFAVFASHFLTRFNFGWGWLFIILAICNTYYTTSLERVRRRSRDDIQRELVKTRLASEHETADWINNFLDRFWLIYEPVLSTTIVSSVDQVLSSNTPPFLDSLRLSTFTLGTKAPRVDKVRTFPKTPDDVIMMDWGISFTPNDVSDMTPRQAALKVNPKIVLSVRVGKGLATAAIPILLEDITFTGLMRIRLKLMSNFPHVQVVDFCFLEKPVIDYVLKPIGGETFGFDIANLLSGTPLDTSIGVLQVSVHSARGIKGSKIGGGTPDPYVSLCINGREELAHTKYKHNTYNPTWMETKFLLVQTLAETLCLNVYDYNDHRRDTMLGTASFDMTKLIEDATQEGLTSMILKDGKDRGELRYDVSFYPVLKPEEGDVGETDSKVGIVRLVLHQAKDLDASKSLSGDLNPLAKVYVGGTKSAVHTTPRFKHTLNPIWESSYEYLCSDKTNASVTVKVIDDRDFLKDPVVGYLTIRLKDLLDSKGEAGRDWFPLSGCKTGKLRMSAEWKPLNMAGSLHGADQYTPPIGVVRLFLHKATDVKNVEAALGGKSDPYTRVLVKNVIKGRTEVINNNLNPVWEQFVYIPVHSLKEALFLECMDYQHVTKDRSLGYTELMVSDLARPSEDKRYPYESIGVVERRDPLRQEKGNVDKGFLHYVAQFVPALALKGVRFDAKTDELKLVSEAAHGDDDDDDGGSIREKESISTHDENMHVPQEITINTNKTHRPRESTDTTATSNTAETTDTAVTTPDKEEEPTTDQVEMAREDLLKEQSGIIIFNVISGKLAKKARLEVLLDDGYWPAFSTIRARSAHATWEQVGEGFVKELDFGQVWFRLNEADEGDKDDIIAEWKGKAKDFLDVTLDSPYRFTLCDEDGRNTSTIEVEARYVPVPVKLDPRESINNQGNLRVDLLNAHDIVAADRGGKSDPYAVFTLNGQRVFKSQTKKKTLSPEWNENFVVGVPSRVGADFTVELFDWNQIEQAKSLGVAKIELADIEPFTASEHTLDLVSNKHGAKGHIRLRLMFQPEIIAKSRQKTSTFSAAGRAMTQIGAIPVGAGKGVFHGVTGVFRRNKDSDDDSDDEAPAGQASQPVASDSSGFMQAGATAFPSSASAATNGSLETNKEGGTLRLTVLDAKDLGEDDYKPYAVVRLGDKEFKTKHAHKTARPEWNEPFIAALSQSQNQFRISVYDRRTLGKDKLLGVADVDIWRHIQRNAMSAADVITELKEGQGLVRVRLEYDPDTSPLKSSGASIRSGHGDDLMSRTMSIASPSRFSLRGRRPGADSDD
ncbi:hypothetical protein ONZ45_g5719 [Pleurotus djamor]|nr:hypothetical protein ONZ45_g5719 [Pleurotus djamor]